MNKMFLSDDTLLRKTMFDGTVMFAAEKEGNKIVKICMFAIPNQITKSAVIKVLMCNRDPIFLGESIEKLEEFIEGSIYTKIRMTAYGEVSYDRYIEFCKEYDVCGYGGHKTFNCEQSLRLSHVSFSYFPEIEVLKDINAEFIPGHMVAIIGESGCGKSTLGKLLMRLLKFSKGEITLDGVDYAAIKHEEYKHNVSYMSQIPFVFSGTIKENLMVGFDGELDEEYMADVLRNTGMISMLKKMPDGLETVVGKDGIMMSVGEMQRLATARVLLRKPKIVILDEPTSSLNIKYDKLVVDVFDKYAKMYNAVVIIITHKETTITMLNEVYVLKDGKLIKSK